MRSAMMWVSFHLHLSLLNCCLWLLLLLLLLIVYAV
jgi:hypothetical protein